MAESMQGEEFSEEQLLYLTGDRALRIWYKTCRKDVFDSIEWGSLSAELVDKHISLFTRDEMTELSAGKQGSREAITSAIRRTPQSVLHAFYKSLCDTQTCGGASQHASIAEEIRKETLALPVPQQPVAATSVPPADSGHPTNSQLATAEPDRGLYVAKAHATAGTVHPPPWQTEKTSERHEKQTSIAVAETSTRQPPAPTSDLFSAPQLQVSKDRRLARLESCGEECDPQTSESHERQTSIAAAEAATRQPSDIPSKLSSAPQLELHEDRLPRLESCGEGSDAQTAPQVCTSTAPAMKEEEEWPGIVKFIQRYLSRDTHRDVLPSLLRELGSTAYNLLRSTSQQIQSDALQEVVKKCRMTRFHFAQCLLRSKPTRPFIFALAKYTVSIPDRFKNVLRKDLGINWYQLATQMGLRKTPIDEIQGMPHATVESKIDTFLEEYPFPLFQNDRQTAEFLVETLERASLSTIVVDVKRDLELVLNLEDIRATAPYIPKQEIWLDVFHAMGGSAEAACENSPHQQDYDQNAEDSPRKTQPTLQHSGPETRQPSQSWPVLKGTSDPTKWDNGLMSGVEGDASLQSVAASSRQHESTGPPSASLESGRGKDELAVIPVTPNDDAYEVFAMFDGSKSEADILQTVSSARYSGLLLYREEDDKQLVHFAAERGYINVLNELCQTGYDITAQMKNGQTPFMLACEAGHGDTIRFLLNHDCSHDRSLVTSKDALGRSCLHYPAILRNKDLTNDLIWDWDAKIDATSNTGITPLSVGCVMGDLSLVQKLVHAMRLKLSRIGKPCKASRLPPLHAAAFGGHQHIMEFLLSIQVNEATEHESLLDLIDPDHRSEDSYTALHIAACKGHLEIVKMLVERYNCLVDASARDEVTPLLLAAASGHEDVVEYLLDHEAVVDSTREVRKGTFHLTPLGEAALGRHQEVVRLLLDSDADFTFKAGGTTSILALACIGGDEEIVKMLLHRLESDIAQAFERKELHKIFEMPFVVSMDFDDFKCAKQLMNLMNGYIGSIDDIIRAFSNKVKPHMMNLLRQYKDTVGFIPDMDLPNQGDTCRRVAGSRISPMYHLCYDDGPHWGTEPMQLCFMFETFHKPEQFHSTYDEVYIEASKCIMRALMEQGYTNEDLANAAHERGSEAAAQFFLEYNEIQNSVLFLEQLHSGNPTAMGVCCELVSADVLEEIYALDLAGPVARQYFMEMSRREQKHPGQFRMKFSRHGSTGTDLRLKKDGQGRPNCRPRLPPVSHSTPVYKNPPSATHVPMPPSTKPQLSASDKLATPSAPGPVEDKPPVLDASGTLNPQYISNPHSMELKETTSIPTEGPSVSCNPPVIPESDLPMPMECSQENDTDDSYIEPPLTVSNDCDRLKTRCSPFTPRSSSRTQQSVLSSRSHPSHAGKNHRSHQQQHRPDVRAALSWSHSTTADSGGAHGGSHVEDPPPPSSPSLELRQPSQSKNPSVAQQSSGSIGTGHTLENIPSHVEAQSSVGMQLQTSQGNRSPDQSSMAPNPLQDMAVKSAMPTSAGLSLSQVSQHQKSTPENAEKSVCATAPELNKHSNVDTNSEPVTDVKRSGDPLSPQAPALSHPALQQSDESIGAGHTPKNILSHMEAQSDVEIQSQVSQDDSPSDQSSMAPNPLWGKALQSAPAHLSSEQPITSESLTLPSSSGPLHSSANPEGLKLSRPDTIGGGFQDDIPSRPPHMAIVETPSNLDIDEGLADLEREECDSLTASPSSQPAPTDSAQFVHLQSSSQTGSPATSHKSYLSAGTIPNKEHKLSSNVASHPTQQSAQQEDSTEQETSDDDDARSDLTYFSSTSASTTHNPTAEDSRNSRESHPSFSGVPTTTASLNTANHPATSAVATAGRRAVSIQAAEAPQSIVTGAERSQNTGQSVQVSINNREQQLSSHFVQPPSTHPQHPSSAHHSQPPTTPSNRSAKVPSHVLPAVVGVPPAEVPSMKASSVETAQSAATVVEADMTPTSASSKHIEQPLAVPCGGGSAAVSSTLQDMERQDSGYLGSNQFNSSILLRRPGYMAPHGGMSLESYQTERDSEESLQRADSVVSTDSRLIGSSTKEEEKMLAYVSRQVGQKWSMLARYAGLKEDDIQEIKRATTQDRSRALMEKIQGRLTWNELLNIVQNHLHMLNTAAKLQHFLHLPVDALPQERLQTEIDPQQYSRTVLLASQCVSEHWKELAQCLDINPHEHWDVLEESSDADEKCHGLLMLWLRDRRATLQDLLEAVEYTSAGAGTLRRLIEMAQ